MKNSSRKMAIGAEMISKTEGSFRIWAPRAQALELAFIDPVSNQPTSLNKMNLEENGYYSLVVEANPGDLYLFKMNESGAFFPDPASRYQPRGPHGPSQIVDISNYEWTDQDWRGVKEENRVIYELHIGTFTPEGTFKSATDQLPELAALGITIIEVMPLNEFPGRFGWGYDGVNLFAPFHHYGSPKELCDFINRAHTLGMAVIIDVVYNHFGPDGNYLHLISPHFFTDDYTTEWGDAINFHGPDSAEVRLFFKSNAAYWIKEYHFDGLRLDATQNIYDTSDPHIIQEIAEAVREAAPHRQTYIVAENEVQDTTQVNSVEMGGYGLDAVWNDDFHHAAMVRLTGRREGYFKDYQGSVQEFISSIKYGYLYQGQWYIFHRKNRGTSSFHLHPSCFITFIQNHDQVANSPHGKRLDYFCDAGNYRAVSALCLLAPGTPMLFQGQEFAATAPFHYFADHHQELAALVFKGRKDVFKYFPSLNCQDMRANVPAPDGIDTFIKCKLNFVERETHKQQYQLYKDLLRLRREDPTFSNPQLGGVDGAVLNDNAFVLHYFGDDGAKSRLIIINFGADFYLSPAPEPLLAAPANCIWEILWSSEDCRYGGAGTAPLYTNHKWFIRGHSATVLQAKTS